MRPPRGPRGWEFALEDEPPPAGEKDGEGLAARLIAVAFVLAILALASGWRATIGAP